MREVWGWFSVRRGQNNEALLVTVFSDWDDENVLTITGMILKIPHFAVRAHYKVMWCWVSSQHTHTPTPTHTHTHTHTHTAWLRHSVWPPQWLTVWPVAPPPQVTGVVLLSVGLWWTLMLGPYMLLISSGPSNAPYVLTGTGVAIVLFGLFGCFATCRGRPWMLKLVRLKKLQVFPRTCVQTWTNVQEITL